jgi:hypothetical protein
VEQNPAKHVFAKVMIVIGRPQAEGRIADALWKTAGRRPKVFTPEESANYLRNRAFEAERL